MGFNTSKFCSNIDLFGKRPQLYISGQTKYSTKAGVILTLILLIFCFICLGYFGKDLIDKSGPEVVYGELYNHDPEELTMNPRKMPFMVGLNNEFGTKYFTEKRLLNLSISEFVLIKGRDAPIINEYPMEICTPEHFAELDPTSQKYFLKFKLKDFFCIGRNVTELKLKGAFDQEVIFREAGVILLI